MRTIREFFEEYKPTSDSCLSIYITNGKGISYCIGSMNNNEILRKAFITHLQEFPTFICFGDSYRTYDSMLARFGDLPYESFSMSTSMWTSIIFNIPQDINLEGIV